MLIATGAFTPGKGRDLRGGFTLSMDEDGIVFETTDDFFFDGSSEPGWALFNGVPERASTREARAEAAQTNFGDLPSHVPVDGVHSAKISQDLDLDQYDTVVLWCYSFPQILGTAKIFRI
jgi:hypothetical protein